MAVELSPIVVLALQPSSGSRDGSTCQVQPDHGYLRALNKHEGTQSSRAQSPGLLQATTVSLPSIWGHLQMEVSDDWDSAYQSCLITYSTHLWCMVHNDLVYSQTVGCCDWVSPHENVLSLPAMQGRLEVLEG